jgi:hypothetical protein
LKREGEVLAEEGRYWEAIKRWDEAISINNRFIEFCNPPYTVAVPYSCLFLGMPPYLR